MSDPRTALVSWSHSDPGWDDAARQRHLSDVHTFTDLLRASGVDADVDLYHFTEGVDWTRWGPSLVASLDVILVVCSHGWRVAWEGNGDPTMGAGAAAEADALKSLYNRDRSEFVRRVRLVLLPNSSSDDVPNGLDMVTRYRLSSIDQAGVVDLLRDLTGQPRFAPAPLGPVPALPLEPPSSAVGPTPPNASASAGLRFRPLDSATGITWRGDWDGGVGSGPAASALHCLRVPPKAVSDREFRSMSDVVQGALRGSGLVPNSVGLTVHEDRGSLIVTVDRNPRRYGEVDHGTVNAVRVDKAGQVTVIRTLPADSMGAILDETLLTAGIAECLSLVAGMWNTGPVDLMVGVEFNSVRSVTGGTAADLGHRSSATMDGAMRQDLRVEPDEIIETENLAGAWNEIAGVVAPSAVRAWRLDAR
jgi:hypothetical protein